MGHATLEPFAPSTSIISRSSLLRDKHRIATSIASRLRHFRSHDMPIIGSHRDLDVWLVSMDLVDVIFRQVKAMPREEFDLQRQIKRAAISIPTNVAEGWCRKDRTQAFQNHVSIAMGSGGELDTELEVCFRNNLLQREQCREITALLNRTRPMLRRLHDSL
jgi:four helix bundle protein